MTEFEKNKFADASSRYKRAFERIASLDLGPWEWVHHAPLFAGSVNIARFLSLYEIYKTTLGVAGHIAEVGTWKGTSLLWFAKLVQIFEPHAHTTVHGFDWFEGMRPDPAKSAIEQGAYAGDYEQLIELIELQSLNHFTHVHKMDVTRELRSFLEIHPSLRFKIVFIDCSVHDVVRGAVEGLWPRLEPGGVLLLDEYNHATTPEETMAFRDLMPNARVQTFSWTRQPSGYVVKD